MIRFYEIKKTAGGNDSLCVSVYRFRGDVPLTIRIGVLTKDVAIRQFPSHSSTMVCQELREVLELLERPRWREYVQSLCLQPNTENVGSFSLFEDLR